MSITHDAQGAELIATKQIRERLTTFRDIYVNPSTGSDTTGTGTSGNPYQTIAFAMTFVEDIDLSGHMLRIRLQDGTYPEDIVLPQVHGAGTADSFLVLGNTSNPENVIVNAIDANHLRAEGRYRVEGVETTTGSSVEHCQSVWLELDNIRWGKGLVATNSRVRIGGTNTAFLDTISFHCVELREGARLDMGGTIDFPDPFTCQDFLFIRADSIAHVDQFSNFTNSSNLTALKFRCRDHSRIITEIEDLDFLPGSSAGTLDQSCAYDGIQGPLREALVGNRTYYVRTDGDDDNPGTSNNSAGAFLTVQRGIDKATEEIDTKGHTVTISVQAGTFTENLTLKNIVGGGSVSLDGQGVTTILTASSGFRVITGEENLSTRWIISDVRLTSTTTYNIQIRGDLFLSGVTFAGSPSEHIVHAGGTIEFGGTTTIETDANAFYLGSRDAAFYSLQDTFTFATGPAPALIDFISLRDFSKAQIISPTWNNSFTGRAYQLVDFTGAEGMDGIPGTIAGVQKVCACVEGKTLSGGTNIEVLSGTKTLTDANSVRLQILDPGGADRDVALPTVGAFAGAHEQREYVIVNNGSTNNLLVKQLTTVLSTVTPGNQATVVRDNSTWMAI